MNKRDLFRMAAQNLWRRKLRTFLTVLGVMIGTSSIVVMLSLGFGLSQSMEDQLASWGSLTNISVYEGMGGNPTAQKRGGSSKLDKNAVKTFKALPHVKAVNAKKEIQVQLKAGRLEAHAPLIGIDPDIMELFEFKTEEGRLLNPSDKMGVVFGGSMSENFYNPKSQSYQESNVDLMRERIVMTIEDYDSPDGNKKSKTYNLKTVGVLSSDDFETSYGVYISMEELEKIIKDNKKSASNSRDRGQGSEYSGITIKVDDMDNVELVSQAVKDLGYEAFSLTEELNSFKQTAAVTQAILGGIGAISLLVAAIGITNTMIMSIYERTKEIGVMKVIGAAMKDIQALFLLEAGLIGLTGGIIGLIFSYIFSYILNLVGGSFVAGMGFTEGSSISIIPPFLALAALAFSVFIGVLAGYFPAKKAMNLSALEAIRTE